MELNQISGNIIGCGIKVHRALGPGLIESAYEACLEYELQQLGLSVKRQVTLPIRYRGVKLDADFRIDLLVEDLVIVEVKAVSELAGIHEAQLLTYMKLAKKRLGLLMNFNVKVLKNGIRRRIL